MMLCEKQDLKKKSKDELVDDLYDSLVEIDKLKRELRKYKNPNTPPSAHPHLKPAFTKAVEVTSHKRGAPKNHVGTNRARKETPNERYIFGEECPNCHSKRFEVVGQKV